MKKFIAFVLTAVIVMSVCCFSALASETAFEITAISYTDGNFKMLEEMSAGDVIYISPTVKKADSSGIQPTVLIGVYNASGMLCNTFIHRSLGMIEGQMWTCASEYTLPQNFDTYMVKTFVFADLASVTAAATSVSKPLDVSSNQPIPDEDAAGDIIFAAEDIYETKTSIDGGTGGTVAVFTDIGNGKYETYDVDISEFYVNGTATTATQFGGYANSDIIGDIELCNASNDVYTTAYVWIYTDMIVSGINPNSYKLYSDYGTLVLDETNTDYDFEIYKNGELISFSDIELCDIVSYAGVVNSNRELESGKVFVSSESVTGSVSSYGIDGNNTLEIDGKTYKYHPDLIVVGEGGVDLGDYAVFYINHRGYICGLNMNVKVTTFNYGFATLVDPDTGFGEPQIRVYDSAGIWNTFDFASRVCINEDNYVNIYSIDWVSATGKTLLNDYYPVNSVIGYVLNDENKISSIYFKDVNGTFDIADHTGTSAKYSEELSSIGTTVIDSDTVIFSIDEAADLSAIIDEDSITVGIKDGLADGAEFPDGYVSYNAGAAIMGKSLFSAKSAMSDFFTVSGISTVPNSAGETVKTFTGIINDEEVTVQTVCVDDLAVLKMNYSANDADKENHSYTTSSHSNISKGSVITYKQNAGGFAEEIIILADINDIYNNSQSAFKTDMIGKREILTVDGVEYTLLFGYVADKTGTFFEVRDTLGYGNGNLVAEQELSITSTGAVVDLFSSPRGTVAVASAGDINFGDVGETASRAYGDVIFAKVRDNIIVDNFVTYRSPSSY